MWWRHSKCHQIANKCAQETLKILGISNWMKTWSRLKSEIRNKVQILQLQGITPSAEQFLHDSNYFPIHRRLLSAICQLHDQSDRNNFEPSKRWLLQRICFPSRRRNLKLDWRNALEMFLLYVMAINRCLRTPWRHDHEQLMAYASYLSNGILIYALEMTNIKFFH